MMNTRIIMTMGLAGTLLAGVAVRAQAETPVVSAQEVTAKLHIAIAKQHSLIDTMEKLKTAYKANPKSPATQSLQADYCGGSQELRNVELDAGHANVEFNRHAIPPPDPETMKVIALTVQDAELTIRFLRLVKSLNALGVTCPDVPSAAQEPDALAKTHPAPAPRPSAENPIKGQMMLVVYFVVGLVVYFLPSVVGDQKRNRWAIFTLNLLLGWTILGWIGALVWALCAEPSVKPVLSHGTNHAMSQNAFCGHCGSPVTTAFCRNCGRRAAL
jgi:hypothetical protein